MESIINKLNCSSLLEEVILSFKGQSLKLNKSDDAKHIVNAILAKDGLNTLILEGNTLGIDAAEVIGNALKIHKNFKKALWSDLFTGRMKTEIPPALKHLSSGIMNSGARLNTLDLSDNAFGPNGMIGLVDLLSSSTCFSLEVLKLNNNGLGITGGKMLAKCLLKCYKKSIEMKQPFALKVFISGRGRLEDGGSIALSEAFEIMGSLVEVSMPQNGITHLGITALSQALAHNHNLRSLNLSDNTFTEPGARSMSKMLKKQKNLERVDFSDCLLRNEGAELVASALSSRSHAHLTYVNLSFNEILVDGGCKVVDALAGKPNLRELHLDGNMFEEDGIEKIKACARSANIESFLGDFDDDEGIDEDESRTPVGIRCLTSEDESDEENDYSRNVDGDLQFVHMFLRDPKSEYYKNLSKNHGRVIINFVESGCIDISMDLFVKMSNSLVLSKDNVPADLTSCIDALFKSLFNQAKHQAAGVLANHILCTLGLIKNEDKTLHTVDDLTTALYLLSAAVRKPFFNRNVSQILFQFLRRSKTNEKFSSDKSKVSLDNIIRVLEVNCK